MGKRPRTPHFITGLGDGNVRDSGSFTSGTVDKQGLAWQGPNGRNSKKVTSYVRKRASERLVRLEPPVDHWKDVFGTAASGDGIPRPVSSAGPWQISAFALLGMIVMLSALFLHLVTDSGDKNRPVRTASAQRRVAKVKRKKTDEWSEDEEDQASDGGAYRADTEGGASSHQSPNLYYPYQPRYPNQDYRHRKPSVGGNKELQGSASLHTRNYYLNQSGAAVISSFTSPASRRSSRSPKPTPLATRFTSDGLGNAGLEGFQEMQNGDRLSGQPELHNLGRHYEARHLSPVSSISSLDAPSEKAEERLAPRSMSLLPSGGKSLTRVKPVPRSVTKKSSSGLELTPATDDVDETPRAGRYTRLTHPDVGRLGVPEPMMKSTPSANARQLKQQPQQVPVENDIPFIPRLEGNASGTPLVHMCNPRPSTIYPEEHELMETGNIFWGSNNPMAKTPDAAGNLLEISADSPTSEEERDDPRKSIIHKRTDLTHSTDSASSLQSSIEFSELKLQEVIGGGGFGQVWKAMWRGTPVAVKVLTGTAQSKHVPKAILEEFAAEINLLKGMRHPNICLYMGACLEPPNRAIVTELAANGSLWDALRLPLAPPYKACDGVTREGWPLSLYLPDRHGFPPSFSVWKEPPVPPKGAWPWILVKKVACGAARGMAYLHSGKPPVLHRDLKSANLLLDESYTTKVCDFGLSRLKSQNRSMTGNCGTVQWMAPEVLANQKYAESADVFSFGIICWELLSRECPYDGMSAIQCALAVLNRDYRPEIPAWCPPSVRALIKACIKSDPEARPTFAQIILALDSMP